jgi:hypothetical protein
MDAPRRILSDSQAKESEKASKGPKDPDNSSPVPAEGVQPDQPATGDAAMKPRRQKYVGNTPPTNNQ